MNTHVLGYKWFIEAKDITGRCEKKKKIFANLFIEVMVFFIEIFKHY